MLDIRFPIITFDKERNIYYARNGNDIVICNNSSLNNGFYDNLLIIDITGAKYNVEGTTPNKQTIIMRFHK